MRHQFDARPLGPAHNASRGTPRTWHLDSIFRTTVRQMLDAWLAHIEHLGRSPTTLDSYRRLVEQLPAGFQSASLKKVTPKTLDDLYRHLMTERPRKPATVLRFHTVLHAAFRQAMKWEWIERSPAERATPPSVQREEIRPPAVLDVVRVLEAAKRSRNPENAVALRVLAATGCRHGEGVCTAVGRRRARREPAHAHDSSLDRGREEAIHREGHEDALRAAGPSRR